MSTAPAQTLLQSFKPLLSLDDLPANAQPYSNPLDAFKITAANYLAGILSEHSVSRQSIFDALETGKKAADLNIPLPKLTKVNPKTLLPLITSNFTANDYFESITATGVNIVFTFNTATLNSLTLNTVASLPDNYGENTSGKGKKMVVDYSSPNIAKPFHAGHLRSTIIGAFLSNLYEANGWQVVRLNYLGDWGKQFGLLAIGYQRYGQAEELQQDAIKHLYDVYVKVNQDANNEVESYLQQNPPSNPQDMAQVKKQEELANSQSNTHQQARDMFNKMENGDQESLALWTKFRDLSIVKYREIYTRLNVAFDIYGGESTVSLKSQQDVVARLIESGLAYEDKGALMIDLERFKLGKTIVRKRDGTTTYLSRDLAGTIERVDTHKPDRLLWVVASQQDMYFAQVFKILELMGYKWTSECQHINFGMVQGMSTRKGTAVFLEQILDEAKETMHEQMRKTEDKYSQIADPEYTADVLGMSAVKIQDMAGKRVNNYTFEWSRMTSFLGDTGPYLQYAHVRLCSIIRKSFDEVGTLPNNSLDISTQLITEPKARLVICLLAQYPEIVKQAFKVHEPTTIVSYCWKLTHAISSAYEVLLVRGQEAELAKARLFFYTCARDVLGSAMRLLTLTPLERM